MSLSAQQRKSSNVTWVEGGVSRAERERRNGHTGAVVWLTGLSGSGKTTIALEVERQLFALGVACYRLDGDNIRHGLNSDLGFSAEDRNENIRRIGEVAKLLCDAGLIVLTSFISPHRRERENVRKMMSRPTDFIEVFVQCPLEESERRDPKGLYKKARAGEIRDFTGVDAPYEVPEQPELVLHTAAEQCEESAERIVNYLRKNSYLGEK